MSSPITMTTANILTTNQCLRANREGDSIRRMLLKTSATALHSGRFNQANSSQDSLRHFTISHLPEACAWLLFRIGDFLATFVVFLQSLMICEDPIFSGTILRNPHRNRMSRRGEHQPRHTIFWSYQHAIQTPLRTLENPW